MKVEKMRGNIATLKVPQQKQEEEGSIKKKISWKQRVEKINDSILNEGNLKKFEKFYDRHPLYEQRKLDVIVIHYMIKFKKLLLSIHGELPKQQYDRLNKERLRLNYKEEQNLREEVVRRCFNLKNDAQM